MKNVILGILITLVSTLSFAMEVKKIEVPKNFNLRINDARSEQSELLKNFQAEIETPHVTTPDEAEVVEFLNSEIRWKSPTQNANNK